MKISIGVLICAALLTSGTARAITLPDVNTTSTVLFNLGGRQDSAELGSLELTDARFGSVAASVLGTPFPSLTASAAIGPSEIASIFGRGSGVLTYYFAIEGPAGTVPVLIDVAGAATGLATEGGSFAVVSRWELYSSTSLSTLLAGDEIRSGQLSGTFSESFGRTVSLTLTTNHVYPIFMVADASAAATALGSHSTADAFVDPFFSFGPGVDPSLYSFSFSAGIGNSPVVPEPGALFLSSAALFPLLLARRDKRPRAPRR